MSTPHAQPAQSLANNREWARRISERDPAFFQSLVAQQSPKYLWIGCSDSRVPANEIVGLMLRASLGLIDNWLRHVQNVRERHEHLISRASGDDDRIDRLCELNVIDQVRHVCNTTIVQDAWRRQQPLAIHGWIYDVHDGLLRDLACLSSGSDEVADAYSRAVELTAAIGPARSD
ncbi:MAG: carbonic anhydrase [Acidobacteria bacterium]|nr:carbonic anhydrase [Acidobacteriota bacterium]